MEDARHHRSVGKSDRAAGYPRRAGSLLGDPTTPWLEAPDTGLWTAAGGDAFVGTVTPRPSRDLGSTGRLERVSKNYFLRGGERLSANRRIESLNRCGSSTKSACPPVLKTSI